MFNLASRVSFSRPMPVAALKAKAAVVRPRFEKVVAKFPAGMTSKQLGIFFMTALMIAMPVIAQAQSGVDIDFGSDDLDVFFTWFNTIFNALLPIALIAAGLTAGGAFVWVIGRMLAKAFTSMSGGG